MKRITVFLIVLLLFSFPASATSDSVYKEQYEANGIDEINNSLDPSVKRFLEENGIDPSKSDWVSSLTGKNVFSHILDFVTDGIKLPFKAMASVTGIILICAAVGSFGTDDRCFSAAGYAATLAISAIIAADVWQSISAASEAIKGCAAFMLTFIPVFVGIVALSGGAVTAAGAGALLLSAAQVVSSVSAFAVLPLCGGYLAISICSGVSSLLDGFQIADFIKKAVLWIISFISTVFLGILSLQTAVNSAADSLTLRTSKFIIGTCVPIAGTALSEAASTITSCISLLRSSVGIYGVAVLAVIYLPVITELILWRLSLTVCSAVASMFSQNKISGLLKAVDMMISVLIGILLLIGGMFIISLTVLVTAGNRL